MTDTYAYITGGTMLDKEAAQDILDNLLGTYNYKLPDDSLLSKTQELRVEMIKNLLIDGVSQLDVKVLTLVRALISDVSKDEVIKLRLEQDKSDNDSKAEIVSELLKALTKGGNKDRSLTTGERVVPELGDVSDIVIEDYILKDGNDTLESDLLILDAE